MDIKKRNVLVAVMQGIICVLFFVPGFLKETFHNIQDWGRWSLQTTGVMSAFEATGNVVQVEISASFLCWIAMGLAVAVLILQILQVVAKGEKQNNPLCAFLPVAELLFVAGYMLVQSEFGDSYVDVFSSYLSYSPGVLCYIMMAAIAALCIVSFITFRGYKKTGIIENPKPQVAENTSVTSELKEYHDLLTAGIITQEEFDAKKKEILGL